VNEDGKPVSILDGAHDRLGVVDSATVRVARVIEVDAGGIPPEFEKLQPAYVLVRPTRAHPDPPSASATKALGARAVTHVGGDAAGRAWIAWARTAGAAVEVGPGADRLDSQGARLARESGVPLLVPTGVDRPSEDPTGAVALGYARRAAVGPKVVRNAAPAAEVTRGWPKRKA